MHLRKIDRPWGSFSLCSSVKRFLTSQSWNVVITYKKPTFLIYYQQENYAIIHMIKKDNDLCIKREVQVSWRSYTSFTILESIYCWHNARFSNARDITALESLYWKSARGDYSQFTVRFARFAYMYISVGSRARLCCWFSVNKRFVVLFSLSVSLLYIIRLKRENNNFYSRI